MVDDFYKNIKKLTYLPTDKIPDISKLVNPLFLSDINNFQRNFKALTKAIEPDMLKVLNIGIQINNIFEKQMKNEYELTQEIKSKLNNLEEELKFKNRHFPNTDILDIFKVCIDEAKYILLKGSVFYRARKIENRQFSNEINTILKKAFASFNDYEYQKLTEKEKDIWDYIINIPIEDWEQYYKNELNLQNTIFWGHNAIESDAPKKNNSQGRVNPVGISCLYATNNINTAISEIQPSIGQIISVAEIEINKELNIFNFNFFDAFKDNKEFMEKSLSEIEEKLGFPFDNIKVIFNVISEYFSRPSFGQAENYYTTQYLSEYIKNKGFDGLIFNSSLTQDGLNIVLFDTSKNKENNPVNYTIKKTNLYKIYNVEITAKQILPK
jgi:copper chaperone CopZ